MSAQAISPRDAKAMIDAGDAVLIDVREPAEYAREHIDGAKLVPLADCDSADFSAARSRNGIFHCRTGARTSMHAERLARTGFRNVYIVAGGLDAWRGAGLPVALDRKVPIDIQRQMQIGAGSMILLGLLLGAFVSPWFLLLSAFVGGGLIYAGSTGNCGMSRLLVLMPWNRPHMRAVALPNSP